MTDWPHATFRTLRNGPDAVIALVVSSVSQLRDVCSGSAPVSSCEREAGHSTQSDNFASDEVTFGTAPGPDVGGIV